MQTDSRFRPVLDLADMMSGLPASVAGSLTGQPGAVPRQNRRLPERILVAAHQACDLGDLDVAAQLLSILETVVGQARGPADPGRRRVMESLIAAHQRLWHLRHGDEVGRQVGVSSQRIAEHGVASQGMTGQGMTGRPMPGFHESQDVPDFQFNP